MGDISTSEFGRGFWSSSPKPHPTFQVICRARNLGGLWETVDPVDKALTCKLFLEVVE